MRRGRVIDFRLKPSGDGIVCGVIRPRNTRRRHRAAAQLHDHFFPRLGRVGHMHGVGIVQHQVRGLQLLVVTGDAVLRNQFARGGGGSGTVRSRCRRGDRRFRRRRLETRRREADCGHDRESYRYRLSHADPTHANTSHANLRTALVLGFAGVAELRIGAMLEEQIRPFLVIQDAAEPVAEAGSRQPGRHARFADRIHIHAEIDQLRQQSVPAAICGTEQGVFTGGGRSLRIHAEIEQKFDAGDRLRLRDRAFSNTMVEARRRHNGCRIGRGGIFGSAPALSRICIISRSSAELASRKGVAPTVSSYPPAILGCGLVMRAFALAPWARSAFTSCSLA